MKSVAHQTAWHSWESPPLSQHSKGWLPAQMAVNAALSVAVYTAANAALNAVLLQVAKHAMGCCDQMLQVCTHKV